MVDANLVFTRKQLCLPASVTISDLTNLVVEGCCADDEEPTDDELDVAEAWLGV